VDDRNCVPCAECGALSEQDYARKTGVGIGNRPFGVKSQESITEWFAKSEVAEARADFGDKAGSCIQADGTVRFKDRAEQRGFMQRKADVMRRAGQDPSRFGDRPRRPDTAAEKDCHSC